MSGEICRSGDRNPSVATGNDVLFSVFVYDQESYKFVQMLARTMESVKPLHMLKSLHKEDEYDQEQ